MCLILRGRLFRLPHVFGVTACLGASGSGGRETVLNWGLDGGSDEVLGSREAQGT